MIAWCFFPQASIFQDIFDYLLTDLGQKVILGLGIYLVVLAVLWLSWTISRPTTQGSMTIHRDHASKVQIDQKAVENNVRLTLGKYDLFNIEVKVKLLSNRKQADVVVVDPPRKGCQKELFDVIETMGAKRMIYVSCDSATLARDLAILKEKGYALKNLIAVDMFPRTPHVECVAEIVKE